MHVLEFDDSHKSCAGDGKKEEVNAYNISETGSDHNSLHENAIEINNAREHTGEDYYDHSGQTCIKKHDTGNIYNAFRSTCNEYDLTAITLKPNNTSNAYGYLQKENEA